MATSELNAQSPPPAAQQNAKPQAADDDPIAHLHKMSTTAGLGSGDYVAVNPVAVFAGLVGLASIMAFADNVLLFIPLVGVVLGVIALYQIRQSNGTQTGKGIAIGGLVLSLLLAGLVGARSIEQRIESRADKAAIETLIVDLGNTLRAGDFDKAYSLFSRRFSERVPKDQFTQTMKFVQGNDAWGKMLRSYGNGIVGMESSDDYAYAQMQFQFEKLGDEPRREDAIFRKEGDHWRIENIPEIFPPPHKGP